MDTFGERTIGRMRRRVKRQVHCGQASAAFMANV